MIQKYTFVATYVNKYPVTMLCRVLGLARSGYYAWKKRPTSSHAQQDAKLTKQIQTVFAESRKTYGSPRVQAALQAHSTLAYLTPADYEKRWFEQQIAA